MPTFREIFCEAERTAFAFLVVDYGFRAGERTVNEGVTQQSVFAGLTYVRVFTPASIARAPQHVTLSIAPLRLELDLYISDGSAGNEFTIEELHALTGNGPFPPRRHGLYEAMHDQGQLLDEFTRLAGVLRDCGSRFFSGDVSLWSDLDGQRIKRAQAKEDAGVVRLSEQAFQRKDWQRVVTLPEPIAPRLSKAGAARLAYARKQLGNTP